LRYLKNLQQKDKSVPIIYCPGDAEFDLKKSIPTFIDKKDDDKNLYNLLDENGLILFEHFPFENDDNDSSIASYGVILYINLMRQHQPPLK
jgi:hypothetical protein